MNPIFVTGAARSGTSLTMGLLTHMNPSLYTGKLCGPTSANKKGQFENTELRNTIVKPWLRANGYDPMGQKPLPRIGEYKIPKSFRNDVLGVLKAQGWNGQDRIIYKGAKICLTPDIWDDAFPDAKFIIVRRPNKQIVNSCLRTNFMRKCKGAAGWERWLEQHIINFEHMMTCYDCKEIWTDKLVKGDKSELLEICDWLGLKYSEKTASDFISPALYTSKT